tara:strand:+ start:66 stop:851 length:786 start_codon:yes stop_codon:yes gene_type:complete
MNPDNLHIITYSNKIDKLEYLKKSENIFNTNVDYIIKNNWEGYITKLVEMKEKINFFNDTDIVIFIDAWDVLINSDKSEIISKFLSYDCDFLVSAELNCYPSKYKNKMNTISPHEKNIYVNAGGYMGYVKNIKSFLEWKSIDKIKKICEKGGDQTYLMEYYIENHNKINIKLDKKALIFQNMHLISWKEIEFNEGRVYNKILNTYPCFIHFNGGAWKTKEKKNIMPIFIELLIKSKQDKKTYNLDKYNQIITKTCFPHPQI